MREFDGRTGGGDGGARGVSLERLPSTTDPAAGGAALPARPSVVVLAGPNGAGKTTLAPAMFRDVLRIDEFVNADTIAAGLSGFAPERSAFAAGRIMMARLRSLAAGRSSFAFETTLATRSFAPWLKGLQATGYLVQISYIWLESPEIAVARVGQRVMQGGHHVPEADIRRRYRRGISNFVGLYHEMADGWTVYDNSGERVRLLASGGRGVPTMITEPLDWERFLGLADAREA